LYANVGATSTAPMTSGLHSSTFRLNVTALRGIGATCRGCLGCLRGVPGWQRCV
jgi:hypothetical protein